MLARQKHVDRPEDQPSTDPSTRASDWAENDMVLPTAATTGRDGAAAAAFGRDVLTLVLQDARYVDTPATASTRRGTGAPGASLRRTDSSLQSAPISRDVR